MLNDSVRWQIFRILRFPLSIKAALWTKIDELQVDSAWQSEVTDVLDRLLAGEANPNALIGSTEDYEPGLKKLDVIEYYEGVAESKIEETRDQLWLELAALVGRSDLMAGTTSGDSGSKYGFS